MPGRMEMSNRSSHACRSAPIEATTLLSKAGYEVLRTSGSNLFDLVAWKNGKVIFLAIRRSRNCGISKWADDVFRLVDVVREGKVPGDVQFWVCRSGVWQRHQILPGGAAPIMEEWYS
jgi:hypothetical protein